MIPAGDSFIVNSQLSIKINSYFPANCHTGADEPSTPVLFPENQNAIAYIRTMWMTSITSATGI